MWWKTPFKPVVMLLLDSSVSILPKVRITQTKGYGASDWPVWDIPKGGGFLRRVSDLLFHRSGSCMTVKVSHAVSLASFPAVPPSVLCLLSPLRDHVSPEDHILHVAHERAIDWPWRA